MKLNNKSDFEFVHDELYSAAFDVVKRFVSKSDMRPILNYAMHRSNGDIVATDSHHLISIKNMHGFKEDYLINPKTLMFAKGKFPDTERLIERDGYEKTIVLDKDQIKLWSQTFKSINQTFKVMKDHDKKARFSFKENHIDVELGAHKITMQLPFDEYEKLNELNSIFFNSELMRNALEAHYKLNSEKLTFYFRGNMRPIILDDNERVKTVILPIRTY